MSNIEITYQSNYNGWYVDFENTDLITEEQAEELMEQLPSATHHLCDEDGECTWGEGKIRKTIEPVLTAFVNKHHIPEGTEFVLVIDDIST